MIRINSFNYYVNQYLNHINPFNILFMLKVDGSVINYINLNDQINKRVMHVMLCYPITNWVVFELVNFDTIIIHIVFRLMNTIEYL